MSSDIESVSSVDIVPMTSEHIEQVAKLDLLCFPDPWTYAMFEALPQNPLAVYFVAVSDGEVVGYAGMYHILDECQIMNIATHPDRRRCGVAEGMFTRLLQYAKDKGVKRIDLEVRTKNEGAIAFYKKLGFEKVGLRKGYYSTPPDDAVLMSLQV